MTSALQSYYMSLLCVQTASANQPIEVITPVEEEVKLKPAVSLRRRRDDYYGSLSDTCMDSLKVRPSSQYPVRTWSNQVVSLISFFCLNQQPESEESPQAKYPQSPFAPPLLSASPTPTQPAKTAVSRIEQVQIATSGKKAIKSFFTSKSMLNGMKGEYVLCYSYQRFQSAQGPWQWGNHLCGEDDAWCKPSRRKKTARRHGVH